MLKIYVYVTLETCDIRVILYIMRHKDPWHLGAWQSGRRHNTTPPRLTTKRWRRKKNCHLIFFDDGLRAEPVHQVLHQRLRRQTFLVDLSPDGRRYKPFSSPSPPTTNKLERSSLGAFTTQKWLNITLLSKGFHVKVPGSFLAQERQG